MTQPNASIAHRHPAHHRCSVGDVARVPYTRSVTFVVASPHMAVAKSPARSSVRRVAQTPGTVGIGAAVIVGHIENLGDTSSFGAVNADGGHLFDPNDRSDATEVSRSPVRGDILRPGAEFARPINVAPRWPSCLARSRAKGSILWRKVSGFLAIRGEV